MHESKNKETAIGRHIAKKRQTKQRIVKYSETHKTTK